MSAPHIISLHQGKIELTPSPPHNVLPSQFTTQLIKFSTTYLSNAIYFKIIYAHFLSRLHLNCDLKIKYLLHV